MNPKRMIIIGTVAITLTMSAGLRSDETSDNVDLNSVDKPGTYSISQDNSLSNHNMEIKDDLHSLLGVSSDELLYNALYKGKSLANIAEDNGKDVHKVIRLQTTQLRKQLDKRLADGSLTLQAYQAHKSELSSIITKSVYGNT